MSMAIANIDVGRAARACVCMGIARVRVDRVARVCVAMGDSDERVATVALASAHMANSNIIALTVPRLVLHTRFAPLLATSALYSSNIYTLLNIIYLLPFLLATANTANTCSNVWIAYWRSVSNAESRHSSRFDAIHVTPLPSSWTFHPL